MLRKCATWRAGDAQVMHDSRAARLTVRRTMLTPLPAPPRIWCFDRQRLLVSLRDFEPAGEGVCPNGHRAGGGQGTLPDCVIGLDTAVRIAVEREERFGESFWRLHRGVVPDAVE